jgi:hypothetical protein
VRRAIAFITYKLRSAAEFAKITMADQTLGNGEVLNVRWATEDPNPKAIEHAKWVSLEQSCTASLDAYACGIAGGKTSSLWKQHSWRKE